MRKLLTLLLLVMVTSFAFSQSDFIKNYKGQYEATLLASATAQSADGYSAIFSIPDDVQSGVFFIKANTISTADTLKIITMYSPTIDSANFMNTDTLCTLTAAGSKRTQPGNIPGRYMKIFIDVAGTSISHDFKLYYVPKRR